MTNPTSNYNFQMPTATDLVTDLPADFEVFGQAVDTRLKALQPGTTLGDLAYSSATANTNTRLPIGTSGQVLAVSGGGVPAWTTTADVTPLTTKGDLFTFTTVDARIGVGANDTVLTADSTQATGLKWATPATGPTGYTLLNAGGTALTGAATITVSGLSAKEILILIVSAQSTVASGFVEVRFNGDTGANYSIGGMQLSSPSAYATGSLTPKGSYSGFDRVDVGAFSSNTASVFSGSVSIDLANTTGWKKFAAVGSGQADGGNSHVTTTNQGIYEASAAITSISVTTTAGNFTGSGRVYVLGAN